MSAIAPRSMTERMIGAAKLNVGVYEEVEADGSATGQAAGVVAIVALCSAIGGIGGGAQGVFGGLIAALLGWALWAGITYLIGDKLLGGTATWGELLRTLGFAQAPGVLFLLGVVPLLGTVVVIIVGVWILVTGVVAIRQALDFGTGRAIATALLGFIPYALLRAFLQV
ncbi:MAG TPA: YIP1 family protein [Longimicrobiales bacterium]|nr:YIP1 family protein [Longimicrobiales bacterium]